MPQASNQQADNADVNEDICQIEHGKMNKTEI
jgi:hypothetical protein